MTRETVDSTIPARGPAHWKRNALAAAVAAALSGMAQGNPTAPVVVNGTANFATAGSTLTVTNTPGTIINWKGFSINTNETTRFVQQSAQSQVLNRVTGGDPSQILGTLSSNGRVFVINPNGIAFGAGAKVDVAGLVASSLNLSNEDFLAGRLNFTDTPGAGKVTNAGEIRTASGGSIFLIAPTVENHGVLVAPDGTVTLAAGKTVLLVDPSAPDIQVELTAPANEVLNVGSILANRVSLFGGIVNHSGSIEATRASIGADGTVTLKATDTTLVSGTITAPGGQIDVLGDKVGLLAAAIIEASSASKGGTIHVGGGGGGTDPTLKNAQAVYIDANAQVHADATDNGDGGHITVWSDQATRVFGQLSARGGANGGNGGFIETSGKQYLDITSSPDTSAPAGQAGNWLIDPYNNIQIQADAVDANVTGNPNFTTTADSAVVTFSSILGALNAGTNVTITTSASPGATQVGDIVFASPLMLTTSNSVVTTLTVQAANNIYFVANSGINSTVAPLNVTLNSDRDADGHGAISILGATIRTNGGNLVMGGGLDPTTGFAHASASTLNGNINQGVLIQDSTISTGAGNITINGTGDGSSYLADGVLINVSVPTASTSLSTTTGSISINGTSSFSSALNLSPNSSNAGILINNGATISTVSGGITITGTGPLSNAALSEIVAAGSRGVIIGRDSQLNNGQPVLDGNGNYTSLFNPSTITSTSGSISIAGTAGMTATGNAFGVCIAMGSKVATGGGVDSPPTTGSITINGNFQTDTTAGSETYFNAKSTIGVLILDLGTAISTRLGDITITGTGAVPGTPSGGVAAGVALSPSTPNLLTSQGPTISSGGGNIFIDGNAGVQQAGTSSTPGIQVSNVHIENATISTIGAGNIEIQGDGAQIVGPAAGATNTSGVQIKGSSLLSVGDGTLFIFGNVPAGTTSVGGGIVIQGGSKLQATGNGGIVLEGSANSVAPGATDIDGVYISDANTAIQAGSGSAAPIIPAGMQTPPGLAPITIFGVAGGSSAPAGARQTGVFIGNSASVSATGTSSQPAILIYGDSGYNLADAATGVGGSNGVRIQDGAVVHTGLGMLEIFGSNSGSSGTENKGVSINGSTIGSDSGGIFIVGSGPQNTSANSNAPYAQSDGVLIDTGSSATFSTSIYGASVSIQGTSGPLAGSTGTGVDITSGNSISASGGISILGIAVTDTLNVLPVAQYHVGVVIGGGGITGAANYAVLQSAGGLVSINGHGGSAPLGGNIGVMFGNPPGASGGSTGSGGQITSPAIQVSGTAGTVGTGNDAITFYLTNSLASNGGNSGAGVASGISLLGSVVHNAGTLQLNATNGAGTSVQGSLLNDGILDLANGNVSVSGSFSQSSAGALDLILGGTSPGQFTSLSVAGIASLGGTLTVNHTLNYLPTSGDQFPIITYGSLATGTDFTTKNFPLGFTYTTSAGPSPYLVTFGAIGGCTVGFICWDNQSGDGQWTTAANWSGDLLPSTTDQVLLNLAGTNTVSLNTGSITIASLGGSNNLAIAGQASLRVTGNTLLTGNLSLAGNFTSDGTFSVGTLTQTGGTAALNGLSSLQKLVLSAGAMSGTGALNITDLDWSGGLMGGTGQLTTTGTTALSGSEVLQRTWNNAGTVNQSGTGIFSVTSVGGNGVVNNQSSGTWTLSNTNATPMNNNLPGSGVSAGGVFNNAGSFTANSGVAQNLAISAFNNSGQVNVSSGTLTLNAANATDTGKINVSSGATVQLAGSRTLGTGSDITGAGAVNFTGGTVSVAGGYGIGSTGTTTVSTGTASFDAVAGANISSLTMTGGVLTGTGLVTVGNFNWSGGTMGGTGQLTTTGTTALSGSEVLQRTWNNAGTVNQSGTGIFSVTSVGGNGVVNNQSSGTWTLSNTNATPMNNNLPGSGVSAGGVFNNAGSFTANSGVAQNLAISAFNNSGQVNVSSGTLTLNAANATDTGKINVSSGATVQLAGSRTLGTGSDITGAGAVNFTGGTVSVAGGYGIGSTGTTTVSTGTASFDAVAGANISSLTMTGGVLTGTGLVTVGNFNWSGGTMGGTGQLTTTGTTALSGSEVLQRTWNNAGTVNQSGTGIFSVTSVGGNGVVNNQSSGTWTLSNTNATPMNNNLPGSGVSAGGVFNNAGSFTANSGVAQNLAISAFNNSGQVNVSSGTLTLNAANATDTGKINVSSGATVQLAGSRTLGTGSDITGAGAVNFTGGTVSVAGGYGIGSTGTTTVSTGTASFDAVAGANISSLTMTGGVLTGTGLVTVGNFNWSGGTMGGTGQLTTTGTTALSGSEVLQRTWNNAGTVNQSGTGIFSVTSVGGNGVVNNQSSGTWTLSNTNATPMNNNLPGSGVSAGGVFNNAGSFTANSGVAQNLAISAFNNSGQVNVSSGTLTLNAANATDTGKINVSSGATVQLAGSRTLGTGSDITGAGAVNFTGGTVSVAGGYGIGSTGTTTVSTGTASFDAVAGANISSLTMTGGVLTGTGLVTVGNFNWSGGTMGGTGQLTTTGTTALSGSEVLQRTWNNAGTVNQSGTGIFSVTSVGGNGVVNNQSSGTWTLSNTNATPMNNNLPGSGVSAGGVFNNAGSFTANSGVAQNLAISAFNNSGQVNVSSGTLTLNAANATDTGKINVSSGATVQLAGSRTLGTGSDITGAGAVNFTGGTVSVAGGYGIGSTGTTTVSTGTASFDAVAGANISSLTMTGGVLTGTGLVTVGNFNWSGGTMGGTGQLTTTGTTALSGSEVLQRTWNNAGTVNQSGTGIFSVTSVGGNGVVNNQSSGTWTLSNTNATPMNNNLPGSGVSAGGVFNNAGSFTANSGVAQNLAISAFNNSGQVNVSSGTLTIPGLQVNAGTLNVTGGSLTINSNFTNNGTIKLNATGAPNTLNVLGSFTQGSTGVLDLQLNGTGANQYAKVGISGAASLGGTLTLTAGTGYTPAVNNTFANLITYGSRVGTTTFATITTSGFTGLFTPTYGATGLSLLLSNLTGITCIGGTICWDNQTGNSLWTDPLNWSTDLLPGAADSVVISLNAAPTINLNSGSYSIASLTGSNNLTVAGVASLNVTGNTSLTGSLGLSGNFTSSGGFSAGTVTQSGGTLTLNGTSTIQNLLLSAGTLTGVGAVTLSGLDWSGGTIAGTGLLSTSGTTLLSSSVSLNGKTWNNAGTVNQSNAARLTMLSSAVVNNQSAAQWNLSSTDTNPFNGTGTFNNAGTLTKSATQSQNLSITAFNNSNQVNVQAGTLTLNSFTNAGTVNVTGGSLAVNTALTNNGTIKLNATGVANTLNVAGSFAQGSTGTLDLQVNGNSAGQYANVLISGNVSLAGTLTLSAGTGYTAALNDSFPNIVKFGSNTGGTQFTSIVPNGYTGLFTPTYSNSGAGAGLSLVLSSLTGVTCSAGFVCWDNQTGNSLWSDPLNWTTDVLPGASDNVLIALGGIQNISLSSGTYGITSLTGSNNLTIAGTASLNVSGNTLLTGNLSLLAGSLTSGGTFSAGTFTQSGGTATFNAATTLQNLILSAGAISGTGALSLNGLNWTGGTLGNSGGLTLNGSSNSVNGAGLVLSGALTLNGALSNAQGSDLTFLGATVDGSAAFTNSGTATLSNAIFTAPVNNASTGTLNLDTSRLDALTSAGNVNLTGINNAGAFTWNGGTLTASNADSLSATSVTMTAVAPRTLNGAILIDSNSAGTTLAGGSLDITGRGQLNTLGSSLVINTGASLHGLVGGIIVGDGGGTITNAGQLTVDANGTLNVGLIDNTATGTLDLTTVNGNIMFIPSLITAGVLNVTGSIDVTNFTWDSGSIQGTGSVNVDLGGSLVLTGTGARTLNGAILSDVNSVATTLGAGSLKVDAGRFDAENLTVSSGAAMTVNNGIVNVYNGDGFGTLTVQGSVTSNGGAINTGALNVDRGVLTANGGDGSVNASIVALSNGGTLKGNGIVGSASSTVLVNNDSGVVSPGNSPGTLFIEGSYSQAAAGTLVMEIAGTAPGTFDQLIVRDSASLNGALQVNVLPGYQPAVGQSFQVVTLAPAGTGTTGTGGGIFGAFSSTNVSQAGIAFQNNYQPTFFNLDLTAFVPPTVPQALQVSAGAFLVALDMVAQPGEPGTSSNSDSANSKANDAASQDLATQLLAALPGCIQ